MNPQDLTRLTTTLFDQALNRPKDQQASFLPDACKGNEQLIRKVKELLDAHAKIQSLPQLPADGGSSPFDLKPESFIALKEHYGDIELIGRGGMGLVFRARHPVRHTDIALKVLLPALAGNEHAIERFRREIQCALEITHTNVCRAYD